MFVPGVPWGVLVRPDGQVASTGDQFSERSGGDSGDRTLHAVGDRGVIGAQYGPAVHLSFWLRGHSPRIMNPRSTRLPERLVCRAGGLKVRFAVQCLSHEDAGLSTCPFGLCFRLGRYQVDRTCCPSEGYVAVLAARLGFLEGKKRSRALSVLAKERLRGHPARKATEVA